MNWISSVLKSCLIEASSETKLFTRKNLIKNHISTIINDTKTVGKTPENTLNKVLQDLRDMGFLSFLSKGQYKLLRANFNISKKQSKGEKKIEQLLIDMNIPFEKEKRFHDLKHKGYLRFDFFITNAERKIVIEYDGIQHFRPVDFFGGEQSLQLIKLRDNIKDKYCKDNNIEIIRIKYDTKLENIKKIISELK